MISNDHLNEIAVCRVCLNKMSKVNIGRKDVLIHKYPNKCSRCGQVKNIILCMRIKSYWKLLFISDR